mgnify:CR=1 FL=1
MVPQDDHGSPPTPTPADVARSLGLQARRSLSPAQRHAHSAAISERLLDLGRMGVAGPVAGYMALAEEADPAVALEALRTRGATVHLPRLVGQGLEFVAWTGDEPLETNRFGIAEPPGPSVPVESLAAVLIPCVAVDTRGSRVGFGAGYYDRTLATVHGAARRPLLVGIAFEVQCLADIERRQWDVPLDVVVTESRTIECS